ncbi:MAG TPA: DUF1801 domain-containing protein [Candidatus Cybelea sp.]|nr:DUF1801 domain-containing protein [Candidatus Cybelea sp.]
MKSPSQKIDERIAELDDWRGDTFTEVRKVIRAADPEVIEEWKWMGTPVWYRDGIIACGDAYKGKVKLTFNQGAHLPDPNKLFNASLDGNQRRAIDFFENDKIDKRALKSLVLAAISFNRNASKKPKPNSKNATSKSSKK